MPMTTAQQTDAYRFFAIAFSAAPGVEYMNQIASAYDSGATTKQIVNEFTKKSVFTSAYPLFLTNEQFASRLIDNVVGTSATTDAKTEAKADVVAALAKGSSRGDVIFQVFSNLAGLTGDAKWGNVALKMANQVATSQYYTETLGRTSTDITTLQAVLAGVDHTTTVTTAALDARLNPPPAGQTFTLTTGIETITGSAGNDTINAVAASGTTGAAITTINSGDSIDGGAGTDTLNITATATNNTSLSGLTVTGVEIINITGANNLATTTTTNAAASAGAAQVAVYDLTTATPTAEVQTLDFGDLTVTAAGTITVGGVAVTLAVGDSGKGIADKVSAGLKADATFNANVSSYSVTGGVLTINFKNSVASGVLLDPAQTTVSATTATFDATKSVTAIGGVAAATPTPASLTTAIRVSINGTDYSTNVTTNVDQLSTTAATKATGDATALSNTRTAVINQLNTVLQGTVTVGNGDDLNEVRLTSKSIGATLPTVSVSQGTSSRSSADTADAFVVANASKTSAEGALSQILTIGVDDGTTANFAGGETFELYVAGTKYATVTAAAAETEAQIATKIATAINAVLGTGVAAAASSNVVVTAPVAGTPLPHMNIVVTAAAGEGAVTFTQTRDSRNALATTSTTTAYTASGASFTGSEQIWLVGAGSNTSNITVTTQTAGLDGVTSAANTINFSTTGALAVKASSGTVTATGATGGLSVSGTTTTGLAIVNTASTPAAGIQSLSLNMSGTSVFDVSGMQQVRTVTSTGAGGVTVNPKATDKLATVTTGAGADSVRVNTATALDDATTTVNEAVNASVSTGAGADTVQVNTSGLGTTTVDTGADGDTVYVQRLSTGVASISTGEGNDTVHLNVALGTYPSLTINAGAGTDTLVMGGGAALTAVDYARMNSALSGFEAIRFNSAVSGIDASKVAIGTITGFTFNSGANVITEVGASQTLTLARALTVTETDIVPPFTGVNPASLNAASAGYVVGTDGTAVATTYGGNLTVAASGASAITLNLKGAAATVGVTATGSSSSTNATEATTSFAPTITFAASDVQSLTVNLTSARGTSTNAASEYMATFNAGTILKSNATTYSEHLNGLSSLKVNGSGVFTINTGTVDKLIAKLTTIDVSGMTAFADQDVNGLVVTPTYTNRSTTTITLNTGVSETVVLGGARDTVVTSSTFANMDTITGFQLTAKAATPTEVDLTRSDVLNVVGTGAFAKFTTTATTLVAALTAAGTSTAGDRLVFTFGGDTYIYVDQGAAGLDDADGLVKLTGVYDLDLLIQTDVLI